MNGFGSSAICILLTSSLLGCGTPDDGDLQLSWPDPDDAAHAELRRKVMDQPSFERVRDAFNENYALPRDLTLRHESCDQINAFYRPSDTSIRMCYEMLEHVQDVFADDMVSNAEQEKLVFGTWWFILFHELGHAVIDLYDLPVLGKNEDAADEFAALTLIALGETDLALAAGLFWNETDTGTYSKFQYADSHSLNPQRFANILCLVHGSDPEATPELADLFTSRSCDYEFDEKNRTWDKLLAEWRL